jgi:hypothetical protein
MCPLGDSQAYWGRFATGSNLRGAMVMTSDETTWVARPLAPGSSQRGFFFVQGGAALASLVFPAG